MATAVRMPQLGESVIEGTVGKWLKSPGDRVEKYEPLLEVVTDKVDSEITSPDSGFVLQIYVQEGETVQTGRLLAYIGEQGDTYPAPGSSEALEVAAPHGAEPTPVAAPPPASPVPLMPEPTSINRKPPVVEMRVSPVVARIAAEHNVDLTEVTGSGYGGRVSKKDILHYIELRDVTMLREQKPEEY